MADISQSNLTELFKIVTALTGGEDAAIEKAANKLVSRFLVKKAKSGAIKILLKAADKKDPQGRYRARIETVNEAATTAAGLIKGAQALKAAPETVSGLVQGAKAVRKVTRGRAI